MNPRGTFGRRPPWWPENEPWPPVGPHHFHDRRARFSRRFGLIFALVLIFGVVGFLSVLSYVARVSGLLPPMGGLPVGVVELVPLIILFIALVAFMRAMWRVGSPLGEVVAAADRVGAGDFRTKVREAGPPFLRSMARAFNLMTDRLRAHDVERRQMMADVAHELRTPLTVMQGRLEGMLDGVYERNDAQLREVLDDTRMLGRLVEDLRTLAIAESHALVLRREPTDVPPLINDVVAAAADRRVSVVTGLGPAVPLISVDPLRLRQVLTNLLDNALRHTPPSGTVSVRAEVRGQALAIDVSDTGSGISAADLPKIFDRFYKGAGSKGSGLGLSIAHRLIAAHGGTITAVSKESHGTTMTVSLPLDQG